MRISLASSSSLVVLLPLLAAALVACASSEPVPAALPPLTPAAPLAGSAMPDPSSPTDAGTADATPPPTPAETIQAAVTAPDRDERDRALDAERHPAEMLSFFGIAPKQNVAALLVGDGYVAELLARVVGDGDVWAENTPAILDRYAAIPWSTRLSKAIMKNVHSAPRELSSPIPSDAHGLDAVLLALYGDDSEWAKVDRAKMNKSVFDSLKSGGVFGIVDQPAHGRGTGVSKKAAENEATKAGFHFEGEGNFVSAPLDGGTRKESTVGFALKFTKP